MPTSETPRAPALHTVSEGETLDRIAAKHYGDATQWRTIAEANDIRDPLTVRAGDVLKIPRRAPHD